MTFMGRSVDVAANRAGVEEVVFASPTPHVIAEVLSEGVGVAWSKILPIFQVFAPSAQRPTRQGIRATISAMVPTMPWTQPSPNPMTHPQISPACRLATRRSLAVAALTTFLSAQGTLVPLPTTLTTDMAMHVANRMTFGQTEALVTQLTGPVSQAVNWIQSQLNPNFNADHPDIAGLLALINVPPTSPTVPANAGHTLDQIRDGVYVYSVLSNFQLAARMAYFWERHFNTFAPLVRQHILNTVAAGNSSLADNLVSHLEWLDYDHYRRNGLGSFRELLRYTFRSPPMMIYLDTVVNTCSAANPFLRPNENFIREFLELYVFGPRYKPTGAPNYRGAEIQAGARIMSGWRLAGDGTNSGFNAFFDPGQHCGTATTIFGPPTPTPAYTTVPLQAGVDDLIDFVVNTEACRDFVCRKLMTEFLGDGTDEAYPALLAAMKTQWGVQGNVQSVLLTLLTSGEFLGASTRWKRGKTPLELVASHARIWDGSFRHPGTNALEANRVTALRQFGASMGEELFGYVTPDGFPLDSVQQPATGVSLAAWRMVTTSYYKNAKVNPGRPPYGGDGGMAYPIAAWVTQRLGSPANTNLLAVSELLLNRAYGSKWTATDRLAVGRALSRDVNGAILPLNPNNMNDYAERLGQAVMATMSFNQAFLR
jgi:uncharacterized protein (DUF1800 family)